MKPSPRANELMQAYFSGKATPARARALEAWLREDESHVRLFVDLALLDGLMLSEQKNEDAAAVLAVLLEAEENAEADFSLLHDPAFEEPAEQADQPQITARELWALAGYCTAKGLRSKAGVISSIAAVLFLGLILVMVFVGQGDPSGSPEIVDSTPDKPKIESIPIVATLTGEFDAVWDRRPGANLYAGQRFELTQGFAEITTARGAVVRLEAPASVGLLDRPNAIRLHAGKLVGICKTESSKGFVVKTDQADITDFGTEFAVESDLQRGTEVHVFAGSVGVKPVATGSAFEPFVAEAGQAYALDMGELPHPIAVATHRFHRSVGSYDRSRDNARPLVHWGFNALSPSGLLMKGDGRAGVSVRGISDRYLRTNAPTLKTPNDRALWLEADQEPFVISDARVPFDDLKPFSVEAWVWVPGDVDGYMSVVSNLMPGPAGRVSRVYGFGVSVSGTPKHRRVAAGPVLVGTRFGAYDMYSATPVPTDQWVHIAVVFKDVKSMSLFVNGKELPREEDVWSRGEVRRGNDRLRIGGSLTRESSEDARDQESVLIEQAWVGGIDELTIYDRALTPDEILAHATGGGKQKN